MALQLSAKILRYENFINDYLKEDLKRVYLKRDALTHEISEYIQLKNSIESIMDIASVEEGFKTKMDLGCSFFVQAKVTDMSRILVNIGLNCYVEFTLDEALRFIDKRISLLNLQVDKLKKDSSKINGTIKLMLGGLEELQRQLSIQ